MNREDREYILLCKRLIEEKFHFGNGNGALRQRDLEYLADVIEEKCGIKLSLSTLKRLWKAEFEQTPHPSTLQALVSVLDYKDWQEFKSRVVHVRPTLQQQSRSNRRRFKGWIVLPVIVAIAVVFWLIAFRSRAPQKKPVIKGSVTFSGNKTVTQGVPNTIIFNYDVGRVDADSFFFQQSWNEKEKVKIDPAGHHYSAIYYYPGFHRAKLIANDSVIRRFRVHITTDGWMPLVQNTFFDNMPLYLKEHVAFRHGTVHVTQADLKASNISTDKPFLLSYYNVREFENTNSDNFSIETRVASDTLSVMPCPGFELRIICEEHIFYVRMMGKGCERETAVKMGEVSQDGVNNDLSALGRDLYQWQDLKIQVANKHATVYIGGQPVHNITFKNNFGKVVGLVYNFAGTGAIDFVRLKNGENKLVYDEEFD